MNVGDALIVHASRAGVPVKMARIDNMPEMGACHSANVLHVPRAEATTNVPSCGQSQAATIAPGMAAARWPIPGSAG